LAGRLDEPDPHFAEAYPGFVGGLALAHRLAEIGAGIAGFDSAGEPRGLSLAALAAVPNDPVVGRRARTGLPFTDPASFPVAGEHTLVARRGVEPGHQPITADWRARTPRCRTSAASRWADRGGAAPSRRSACEAERGAGSG